MDIFGTKKIKELNTKIETLTGELLYYKNEMNRRESFKYMLDELIPSEQNARKSYMADITMFYTKIFKNKLAHFISKQKDSLAMFGNNDATDAFIRSNINVLGLIDEWMSDREKEHLGNLANEREKQFGNY